MMSVWQTVASPRWLAVGVLAVVLWAPAPPASAAGAPPIPAARAAAVADENAVSVTVTVPEASRPTVPVEGTLADAELRWGINTETGSGAFAGGCNFLSAGRAQDAGGVKVWTEADGLYASAADNVRIVKADTAGGWEAASFATRCLDRHGRPVSAAAPNSHTETQVVMSAGTGTVDERGVQLRWSGSFTVVLYGGMTYWSATDPVLTMDARGNGQLRATLSGFATDREDMGKWSPVAPRPVVLAEIRGAQMTPRGFAQAPEYVGVAASIPGQAPRTLANAPHWGAFPDSFLRFQELTGQSGYWMATDGQRDRAKVPTTLYVSYDARSPIPVLTGPAPGAGSGAALAAPVVQRALGAPGGPAGAALPAPEVLRPAPAVAAATVVRDDGRGLVPRAATGLPDAALPAALSVLSLLVASVAAARLAGIPVFPWRRRAVSG